MPPCTIFQEQGRKQARGEACLVQDSTPMRHHHRLSVLLPALASAAIVGCGGTVGVPGGSSGSSSGSSGSSSGSSGTGSSSGTSGSSGVVLSGFDVDVCTGTEYRPLDGVTRSDGSAGPHGGFEYMALREQYASPADGKPFIIAETGSACANALDRPTCEQELAAFRSEAGWQLLSIGKGPSGHRYIVYTTGDSVQGITSIADLRAFIAPAENAKDAALLATVSGKYRITCDGTKNAKKTGAGWELHVLSGDSCGAGTHIDEHVLEVTSAGDLDVKQTNLVKEGDPNCAVGRRPKGLHPPRDARENAEGDAVGCFFAEVAHLEAASVVAFERLAEDLAALGAPQELIDSALASRDDEIRHARMTAKVAKRFGGLPQAPRVERARTRSAVEIALENAVEGCVRETYGALIAHHQAAAASDSSIACIMHAIAEDETRHAGLAWDVAAWLEPQLAPEARREVEAARVQAIAELRANLASEPAPALRQVAGMPGAASAIKMLDALTETFLAA